MKASAYLILLTARKKKNGKYPVKIRVVFQRAYKDYRTGLDLTEDEFSQANLPKPKKEYRGIAVKLNDIKTKMDLTIESLKVFTFKKFETAFWGPSFKQENLFGIYQEYINNVLAEERIKTATSYTTAMNSLRRFSPKVSILDIDHVFLKQYHSFLEKEGKSLSTIGIYMRSLRAVYNYAISKRIISKNEDYPFVRSRYTIPGASNIKKALTKEEIRLLFDFETIPGTFMDRAKDFWILSYLCNGINFKDIALLQWKNIDGDMIRFVRQKTRRSSQGNLKIISCHINKKVFGIIEKWSDGPKISEALIFNIVDSSDSLATQQKKIDQFIQNTNKNLKKICSAVGIKKPVTTYYSRHSAATILMKEGASVEQISDALGHSSILTTQKYLDTFSDLNKKKLSIALNPYNLQNE
jgi:integrase/recombinase XerD